MSLQDKFEESQANKGQKSEEKEVVVIPQSYKAKGSGQEDFESKNAFSWEFLFRDDVPEDGIKATIAAPPFHKLEDNNYSDEEEALYVPLILADGAHKLFRLSDTRKYSLRNQVGSDPEKMTGRRIRIEKQEMGNGVGLKVTDELGMAPEDTLNYIRNEIRVVDEDRNLSDEDIDTEHDYGNLDADEVE